MPQQKHRLLAVGTPFGEDVLVIRAFSGVEELGRPYRYDLDLVSEKHDLKFTDIVGHNVTVRLQVLQQKTRYFNGFVSSFEQLTPMGGFAHYHAVLVPWLWFLTRTADCRIFQKMKVSDIVSKVFRDHGFSNFSLALSGTYQPREYCVQYRESDFNFVSRLLEQEGIYYFFKHDNGKHTMVLADDVAAHDPYPDYTNVSFYAREVTNKTGEVIREWTAGHEVQTGTVALTDYDFEQPKKGLRAKTKISRGSGAADFEAFDYPGEYTEYAEGQRYSRLRVEELQSGYETAQGQGNVRGVATGYLLTLADCPRSDQNRKYLITGARYDIKSDEFVSSSTASGDFYTVSFQVVPATQPFRPRRLATRPVVQGPQTAFVVGPSGSEIYVDKYGRVKLQFHWDRYGKADENSSCWVRVAQSWAGKKWGAMYIPRIGQEVIVDFLEGDPDQPIITGRVYNGINMPPYALPDNATRSTLKSNSSKGGGGFNEVRFEDKKGEEQIFIHAEKNEDVRVKNDSFEWIGHDRHLKVINDQYELVKVNKHSIVEGERSTLVKGDDNIVVKGGRYTKVTIADHREVTGDEVVKIGGDQSLKVGGKQNIEVADKISRKGGADIHEKAAMNYAMDAGMAVHIKGGMNVVIEAGLSLTIKVGGNYVNISPAGVAITGTLVLINSGGAAGSGGGSSPTAPASPTPPDEAKEAKDAADDQPGEVESVTTTTVTKTAGSYDTHNVGAYVAPPPLPSTQAQALNDAAHDGSAFCEECERARQEEGQGS